MKYKSITSASRSRLRGALLTHYDRAARALPWRGETDPYRVLVSEIMLQQTRVDQGLPYYLRFIEALPTGEALATATEDQVLKLWEGLGYSTRARNLHKAARIGPEHYGGPWPQSAECAQLLPGFRPSTAGSAASLVCG